MSSEAVREFGISKTAATTQRVGNYLLIKIAVNSQKDWYLRVWGIENEVLGSRKKCAELAGFCIYQLIKLAVASRWRSLGSDV